ncbi:efflux RND transporter periplasmic adaptor subunit [Halalkalibacter akibai]|uniref:Probable Co/Zn/Cd efflux system membrane fusion protein n=1 Tax=Halalkalibacter akibai (strain ATCC 43226 / DSM 21942 / CIP 109018 / JCM 9157 / 1139) TaxID=1236973 RepID=W4QU86_HALA3|nr:efflux RND transporter periplasmic adaptor subunit [Halalkalibacter akibai]GAE35178.1 probable Co/Zn/Cd efflux system membrane fusion protein [Halalkalibacter akibai JCM 9157]
MTVNKNIWLALIVLLLLITGCSSEASNVVSSDEEAEAPVHPVEIAEINRGILSNELKLPGTIMAGKHMPVLPMLTGEVTVVHVKNGDTVKRGDTLIELDASDVELNIAQARAGLDAAKANLNSAKTMRDQSIKQAELQLSQARDMHQMLTNAEVPSDVVLDDVPEELQAVFGTLLGSNMPTEHDINQAKTAVKQAEMGLEQAKSSAQIDAAQASVKQAEISVQMAEQQKTHAVVTAPMAGQVTGFNTIVGEMVSPQAPLLQLVQMDSPIVQLSVTESMLPSIELDQSVQVYVKSFNQSYEGRIKYISLLPGEQSRSYPVEIELVNPDENLRVGMLAEVVIETAIANEQVLLPVAAVVEENNEQFVYVIKDDGDQVERRVISIANETAEWFAIEDGLNEGDFVVIRGNHQLYDGAL